MARICDSVCSVLTLLVESIRNLYCLAKTGASPGGMRLFATYQTDYTLCTALYHLDAPLVAKTFEMQQLDSPDLRDIQRGKSVIVNVILSSDAGVFNTTQARTTGFNSLNYRQSGTQDS